MKRGTSGLNLVVGLDKPAGISSHDAVSRCRKIFQEGRIGHAGTLDPQACGVLPILIGSAARLNTYLSGHDKKYIARICFGRSTETDDAAGKTLRIERVPDLVSNAHYAAGILDRFVGSQMQLPPVYSAIKKNGKKACDEARRGNILELEPRSIEVYSAELIDIAEIDGELCWNVAFNVSSGTYIRSLARDIARACNTEGHISGLRRVRCGNLDISDCVDFSLLEKMGVEAAVDPVRLLGFKLMFASENDIARISNGMKIDAHARAFHKCLPTGGFCSCNSGIVESPMPDDGENVCIVGDGKLHAICRFNDDSQTLLPSRVFQKGITRGVCI